MNKRVIVKAWLLGCLLVLCAFAAKFISPRTYLETEAVWLQDQIPTQFGDWHEVKSALSMADLSPRKGDSVVNLVYDQTVSRTYQNSKGNIVMLAIAYGREQRQEVKIHRPELCYAAQGFQLLSKEKLSLPLARGAIPATRLLVRGANRYEPVTYWIRLGDEFISSPAQMRLKILIDGLKGTILDGILVRVSSPTSSSDDANAQYDLQIGFINDLLDSLSTVGSRLIYNRALAKAQAAGNG